MKEREELRDMVFFLKGEAFKKHVLDELKREDQNLKEAYKCQNLYELNFIRGKKEGLDIIRKLIADISVRYEQLTRVEQAVDNKGRHST